MIFAIIYAACGLVALIVFGKMTQRRAHAKDEQEYWLRRAQTYYHPHPVVMGENGYIKINLSGASEGEKT